MAVANLSGVELSNGAPAARTFTGLLRTYCTGVLRVLVKVNAAKLNPPDPRPHSSTLNDHRLLLGPFRTFFHTIRLCFLFAIYFSNPPVVLNWSSVTRGERRSCLD
jgi:hypothetical protein